MLSICSFCFQCYVSYIENRTFPGLLHKLAKKYLLFDKKKGSYQTISYGQICHGYDLTNVILLPPRAYYRYNFFLDIHNGCDDEKRWHPLKKKSRQSPSTSDWFLAS